MSHQQLGPIDVCCDAPPYPIVQASSQIGIQSPEDNRWCRLSQHGGSNAAFRQLARIAPWNIFLASSGLNGGLCNCGQVLPRLAHYIFTLDTGQEVCYALGQCSRCHAVYWEEA